MEEEPRENVSESSEDEADSFDNYGVFQSDYEFKFVQEGNDKTTLMLPPVTYDSMEVKYFNIEIEVDSELLVSALEKEETVNGTTRFFFRIAKHGLQHGQGDEGEIQTLGEDGYEYEELKDNDADKADKAKQGKGKKPKATMDVHNYSKPKVVMASAPSIKIEVDDGIKKAENEALDGTQLDKDNSGMLVLEEFDDEEDMDDDGDDDDDMDDLDESDIAESMKLERDDEEDGIITPKRKAKKKAVTTSEKKRRKYDRTNHYSKNSSNFTVEMTDEGQKVYKCNICQRMMKQAGNMRGHIRTHTGERPFTCNICGYKCSDTSNLNGHMQTHTTKKSHFCNVCGSEFKTRQTLKCHYRRHVQPGHYQCPHCKFRSDSEHFLKSHMVCHTGEKNHVCNVCSRKFARKCSLQRHMEIHSEPKFECNLCSKSFHRREYFRNHLMKMHHFSGNEDVIAKKIRKVEPLYDIKQANSVETDVKVEEILPDNDKATDTSE